MLSTCNRTGFYLAAPREAGAVETMLAHLRRVRPQAPILRSDCLRSRRNRAGAGRARALLVERMGALHGLPQEMGQILSLAEFSALKQTYTSLTDSCRCWTRR